MRFKRLWIGLMGFALCGAQAQELLPVTRVVLYRSGVGYIERFGRISGDATLTMAMRESQMNDLLKSLILVDLDGGQVLPAQYTPRDPLERTLSAFAIQLSDNPSMATLLNRLRGVPVEIQTEKETLQGTVLSIEVREEAASEVVVKRAYVNLMTNPAMRSVPLDGITSLRVRDERLQGELQNALATIATGLDNTRKTIQLRFTGQGARRVLVGYLTEMPLWKMTYRLALSPNEPPLLQGWAIVENTTDEDWRNVRLELVSGRPVSFIQNLYEPIYPKRPTVQTQTDAALMPDVPEAAMELKADEMAGRAAAPSSAPRRMGAPGEPGGFGGFGGAPRAMRESIVEMAQGQERGALFDYRIQQPVTILRQQSALVPVINRAIEAETVSLYNPANHPRHPFFGVKLTNTTDLTLMEGPVTVYLDGAYGGDAQLETLEPKGERILTYALDLGIEVVQDRANFTTQMLSVKIVDGVLQQRFEQRMENLYRLTSRDDKPRTVLIEQPYQDEWELVQPAKFERTATFYRFPVEVQPRQTATLRVVQKRTTQESFALLDSDEDLIRVLAQNQQLSEPVRQALNSILNRRRAIRNFEAQIRQQESRIKAITDDQARIRENMRQLDRNSALYREYVQKLTEQEREIEAARREIERLQEQRARAQRELSEYIAGLNL
ncbi:MAG: hypothetical protein KatS3mg018_0998 [Fimbriimonadales bacterium]|nr:MAG: hypothetical protein KatS3mg018_0998 [Fimbriimonadales bacterium]